MINNKIIIKLERNNTLVMFRLHYLNDVNG